MIPIKYIKTKDLVDYEENIKPIFDLTKTEKFIVKEIKKGEKRKC